MTRDQAHFSYIGRWILNHLANREASPQGKIFKLEDPELVGEACSVVHPSLWKTKVRSFHLCGQSGFPNSSVGKESACKAGDPGSIPGLGRSPGEGKGHPLKSRTRMSLFHFLGNQRNNPKYGEKALSPKRLFAALSVRAKHVVRKKKCLFGCSLGCSLKAGG